LALDRDPLRLSAAMYIIISDPVFYIDRARKMTDLAGA
jgi:hypothetical protein